jgi:lipoprotein-releasing system permease protein
MIFIALRQLFARKRQTILTLLGVAFGTMGYIVISGMMLGQREYLLDQLVNADAHVKISARSQVIRSNSFDSILTEKDEHFTWLIPPSGRKGSLQIMSPARWQKMLKQDPAVTAVSPQLTAQAIFQRGSIRESGKIIGIIPSQQLKVSNLARFMIEGKLTDLTEGGNKVVIGEGLRSYLGCRVSENIFISNGGQAQPFKVVGIFQTGNKAQDDAIGYAYIATVQRFNNTPGQVSDIGISLTDVDAAPAKAAELQRGGDVKAQSWQEASAGFLSIFKLQDIIRFSVSGAILIVAAFGIYNILNIVISQKKREIAILRSIGYENRDILTIFMTQGALIGIFGGIAGMIIGFLVCLQLSQIEIVNVLRPMGPEQMAVSFAVKNYVFAFMLAFVSTMFASFLPARAAGRLSPIDTIREQA